MHVSNSDLRKSGMNPIHYIELKLETKEVDGVKKKVKKHYVAAFSSMADVDIDKFMYKRSVMLFLPSKCMTNHVEADKSL